MSTGLDSAQSDWVEAEVGKGFERSKAVNSVLFGKSGVPAMPEADQVIRLAQAELAGKKAAVDFMMGAEQGGRPVFSYQTKLVSPSNRIDLVRAILDGQPKTMGTSDQPQLDAWMWGHVERHLASRPSRVESPTWYWELGQGDQIIETPQRKGNSSMNLIDWYGEWLGDMAVGMRGTDLFTWATRMAAGLREGKPLDIGFPNNATDTPYYNQQNFTILDLEGMFMEGNYRCVVGGSFNPNRREPVLTRYYWIDQCPNARFRATIGGPISK